MDLLVLLDILWKQRLLILVCTILSLAAAFVYVFAATPIYEVTMQIRPGITSYDKDGNPVRSWKVSDIMSWIDEGLYRPFLISAVKDEAVLPRIEAASKGSQELISLSLKTSNPKLGESILDKLVSFWVKHYAYDGNDQNLLVSRQMTEQQIDDARDRLALIDEVKVKDVEMKIAELKRHISVDEEKIKIFDQRINTNLKAIENLQKQLDKAIANSTDLINLRNNLLGERKAQDLSLLLYTNIIQQNISYVSQLQERIAQIQRLILDDGREKVDLYKDIEDSRQKIEEQNLELKEKLPQQRNVINREIAQYQQRLRILSPVEVVSPPVASEYPVRPRKAFIIALAGMFGLSLGLLLAILLYAWQYRSRVQIMKD
mgnify:CR=1 FL=1